MDTLFTPPTTDKVINRGGREKIPAYLFIDPDEPNVLYVSTKEDIEIADNSIYELNIPQINFADNSIETKFKYTFITSPSPVYADVDDVLKECRNIPIEKDIVIHSIKEASETVDFWAYHNMDDEDIPTTEEDKLFVEIFGQHVYHYRYKATSNTVTFTRPDDGSYATYCIANK